MCKMKCSFCGADFSGLSKNVEGYSEILICPFCGKITEDGEQKFGSLHNTLIYLLSVNSYGISKERLQKIVDSGLSHALDFNLNTFLKVNHLKFENRNLNHICGYRLLSNFIVEDKLELLEKLKSVMLSRQFNFCPCCGEKFKFDLDIEDFDVKNAMAAIEEKSQEE